ncbi:helix-turn-helix domain-containing protein [Actinoplanes rectilineatus]|uniref:helix-turn-helix domain-containing protein n=1 Tax=Actinoplanes rectilineatus TaxID=113571 RepID=UPI0009FA6C97|nr:helix-turn-helix transcriptional regulator [Actinoplanes rectilineatus]
MPEEMPKMAAHHAAQYDFAELGRAAARVREAAGMTVADVAERAGLPEPVIDDIESGQGDVDLEVLHAIAHALGVGIGKLIVFGESGQQM